MESQNRSLSKLMQLTQKMSALNKMTQGSSLQVMEKDKEWSKKYQQLEKESNVKLQKLQSSLESAIEAKQIITRNYDNQITMITEHMATLGQ